MNTKVPFLLLAFCLPVLVWAQAQKPDCLEMVATGDRLAAAPDPDLNEVLVEYLAALNCDVSLASVLALKIQGVFRKIEAQKQEAIDQRRRAERQTQLAVQRAIEGKANEYAAYGIGWDY